MNVFCTGAVFFLGLAFHLTLCVLQPTTPMPQHQHWGCILLASAGMERAARLSGVNSAGQWGV